MTARTSFIRMSGTTALLLLLLAGVASAATWTVARDGSGDFRVLQDAVDAASSGDVIEIGPGRYDEYQTLQFGVLWFDLHVLLPDDMSLTFIGSGATETIIGPADPDEYVNRTYGIGGLYGVDAHSKIKPPFPVDRTTSRPHPTTRRRPTTPPLRLPGPIPVP